MKQKKAHVAVLSAVIFALAALAASAAKTGYGQSQSKKEDATPAVVVGGNHLQPTAVVRERRATEASGTHAATEASDASVFGAAATRNTALRYELDWAFGTTRQRGWYLYVPLISRTIGTERESTTNDFASALSRWQKREGLDANGVLDDKTIGRMVSGWQGARLKDKTLPSPEQLLLAPASDFLFPSRPAEKRMVERETYAAYKRMVAAALADPSLGLKGTASGELAPEEKYLKLFSTYRTSEDQTRLRAQLGRDCRACLAVNSPHFTGRALDIYVGGEPDKTLESNRAVQVQTKTYQWLVRNADRFGFKPYYYEPWHWEYVGAPNASSK